MTFLISSINFMALGITLWMGLYIVTRSQGRHAWLAGATLWALAAYFLNRVAYINFPDQNLLPSGLGPTLSAALWYHLSVVFVPSSTWRRLLVPLGYGLAAVCIFLLNQTELIFVGPGGGTSIVTAEVPTGPLYPIPGALLLGWPVLGLWNFNTALQASPPAVRSQVMILRVAAMVTVGSVMYLLLPELARIAVPTLLGDLGLALAVTLIGYALARYNAFLEGRATTADLPYASVAMAVTVLSYLAVTSLSYRFYGIPLAALTLLFVLVIVSHTLYDGFRSQLDRLFYRRSLARLRRGLRVLAQDIRDADALDRLLHDTLTATCLELEVKNGMVVLDEDGVGRIAASLQTAPAGQTVPSITPPEDAALLDGTVVELRDMAAIAPIVWSGERLGYLTVGSRASGYTTHDLAALAMAADRMAGVIYAARAVDTATTALSIQVQDLQARERELQRQVQAATPTIATEMSEAALTLLVEDALRHLHDFTYLGEHRLARLPVFEKELDRRQEAVTPLKRGQAVRDGLLRTLERLRPTGAEPRGDAAASHREWYAYLILRESYVEGIPNRDTMNRLAISEGTYNRTRRQALRGLARDLATQPFE